MPDIQYLFDCFSFDILFWMFVGSLLGVIFGALPGLGPETGIALFLPITFNLQPAAGLAALGAIFVAGQFGGNITAILINTPGTSDSFLVVLDGFPMTKRGQGARAIALSTVGAFIGGVIGALTLIFLASYIANVAIKLGPLDTFLITMIGICVIVSLTQNAPLKGFTGAALGLAVGFVGADKMSFKYRYTFGVFELMDGFQLLPIVLGLFAIAQMYVIAASGYERITAPGLDQGTGSAHLSWKDLRHIAMPAIRGALIGTAIGIVPSAGGATASSLAYDVEKNCSKHPEKFGDGSEEGIVALSSSINGVCGGALVPLITLCIPGCSAAALFLGGLMIHGLYPGEQLFSNNPQVVYPFMFSLLLAQFFILFYGLFCGKYFAKLTTCANSVLVPIIMLFTTIGAYSSRKLMFDLYLLALFGLLGYLWARIGYGVAPFCMAFVLGKIAEQKFRLAYLLMTGNIGSQLLRPLPIILLAVNLYLLLMPVISIIRSNNKNKKSQLV